MRFALKMCHGNDGTADVVFIDSSRRSTWMEREAVICHCGLKEGFHKVECRTCQGREVSVLES